MAYGLIKIGVGLIGVGTSIKSAQRDAQIGHHLVDKLSIDNLGRFMVVEISDRFMVDIERQKNGFYDRKEQVKAKLQQARENHRIEAERARKARERIANAKDAAQQGR